MQFPFGSLFISFLLCFFLCKNRVFSQPFQWQAFNETADSLRFSIRADTLYAIGPGLFTAVMNEEHMVFQGNPLHPLFRTRLSRLFALNQRWFSEDCSGTYQLRECRNPRIIFRSNLRRIHVWNQQVITEDSEGRLLCYIGDSEPMQADSFRILAGKFFAFRSGGISIIDSLLKESFVKTSGKFRRFNALNPTYVLCDSTWIPLNGRSLLFRERPGAFWWNDSCLLDTSGRTVYLQSPSLSRRKIGECIRLLSSDILWLQSGKKFFIVFRNGKKVAVPAAVEMRVMSEDLCAIRLPANWILVSRRGQLLSVKPEVSDIRNQSGAYLMVQSGKRWGMTDLSGILRISCRYDSLLPVREGRIPAKIGGFWGYLDKDEHIRVQPHFESVQPFADSLGLVKRNGKWGLIRPDGSYLLECDYHAISPMSKQKWKLSRGLWKGIFSSKGNFLLNTRYSDIIETQTGLFQVEREGKKGLFSKSGTGILPIEYSVIQTEIQFRSLICR
jgi:hypothetical protein